MMSAIKTSKLFNQRSFVNRKIDGVAFKAIGDSALVTKVVTKGESKSHAANLALIDLSVAARIGFRGANAKSHLEDAQLPIPSKPNMMMQSKKESLMTLRLSDSEYWILDGSTDGGEKLHELTALPVPDNCYRLYCQHSHAWFMLTGQYIEQTMAKICGVDLRKLSFPLDTIVQTSVAKVNAVIVRHEVNEMPVFSVLSDSASAEYLWDCLLDAMDEFDGQVVGIDALALD
jgi:sarcosine oxidase subunit gamma